MFYIGINDFYNRPSKHDRVLRKPKKFDLEKTIENYSALFTLWRKMSGTYEAMVRKRFFDQKINFDSVTWTTERFQQNYDFLAQRIGLYADRLRALVDLSRDMGAMPVFVTQSIRKYRLTSNGLIEGIPREKQPYDGHVVSGVDLYWMMQKMNNVVEAIAREKGIPYIPLGDYRGWKDEDFYDFLHLNPSGTRKLAELMHPYLKEIVGDTL